MAVNVSSEDERLLCVGDAMLHPIHVEQPSWHTLVDVSPTHVEATRRALFYRAMEEKALVLAFHFPFPGLGRLIQKKEQYHWQPI
jgi:hypothetical protein